MDNYSIHTIVPQLRFPEFKNDENWEVAKVGDVIKTITPPKKINSSEYKKSGKYPIIDQSQSFICGYSDDDDALMNHNNEDLIVFGDHTCVLKFVSFPFIQGADGIKIIKSKDSNKLVESFLFQSLQNNPVVSREYKRHFSELKEKEFCFSRRIAEQRKIASCLFSMDAYISATKEKLELLKTYKKGLMQKLFPAKGKKLPELRFKEFEKDGEWEEKKLATIVHQITTGKLDANAMVSNGEYRFYTCAKDYAFINEYAFDTEALLISGNGAHLGYIHYYKGKFNAYQRTYVLSDFQCDIFYLKYYLESFLPDRINKEKKEGNTPYIVLSTLTEMDIILPSNFEQHKIADCLTSIDEMINQYTNKVTFLELYKKGLMQQMFPTNNN